MRIFSLLGFCDRIRIKEMAENFKVIKNGGALTNTYVARLLLPVCSFCIVLRHTKSTSQKHVRIFCLAYFVNVVYNGFLKSKALKSKASTATTARFIQIWETLRT